MCLATFKKITRFQALQNGHFKRLEIQKDAVKKRGVLRKLLIVLPGAEDCFFSQAAFSPFNIPFQFAVLEDCQLQRTQR